MLSARAARTARPLPADRRAHASALFRQKVAAPAFPPQCRASALSAAATSRGERARFCARSKTRHIA